MSMSGRAFARAALAIALSLAGCSSRNTPPEPLPFQLAAQRAFGALKARKKPADARSVLTRAAIDATPGPILLAGVESRQAYATLTPSGHNRGVVSWVTGDGVSLSFRNGVLVATRGLGQDLMAADVSDVLAALHAGQGPALRIHDYLDGEEQVRRRSFYCTIRTEGRETLHIYELSVTTRRLAETCKNPTITFTNRYWISSGNRIRQSHQWAGPLVGYVFTQQLSK